MRDRWIDRDINVNVEIVVAHVILISIFSPNISYYSVFIFFIFNDYTFFYNYDEL